MKIGRLLFLGFVLMAFNLSAQNLKPDLAATRVVNVPPMNMDYIGLTRIYVLPKFVDDRQTSGLISNEINTSVYSLESGIETSDMYFTSEVYRVWKKNATPSASQTTSKDKQGNTVTTTTYKYDSDEEIRFELTLFLANGTKVSSNIQRERLTVSGTSTVSYQRAYDDYLETRRKKTYESIEKQTREAYAVIANQYLFTQQSVFLYSIGVKSRKMDYADMNMAAEYMNKWLASNPGDMSSSDVIEANKLYDAALVEYEPDNKKARVDNEIAAVCYYAKACQEFMLNNYRKAEEYILKSEELDPRIHHSQEAMKNTLALLKERKVFN